MRTFNRIPVFGMSATDVAPELPKCSDCADYHNLEREITSV